MNATVSTLYKNGKHATGGRTVVTVKGDLNMGLIRNLVEASVTDDKGTHLLPPLLDAHCSSISAAGLTIRGVERINGREVAQEWWCNVEQKDMP